VARDLERIAHKLRQRVEQAVASEWFSQETERLYGLPRLSRDEFRRAMRLKAELIHEFRGARLSECYTVREVETEHGRCAVVLHHVPEGLISSDPEAGRRALATELKLLHGIGPCVEDELRSSGYETLEDLQKHPRWGAQAHRLLGLIREGDVRALQRCLHRWLPVSHPLGLKLLGFVPQERLFFFDLESLGLFGRPIVLLGTARPCGDGLEIAQYLVRDITEELPALAAVIRLLGEEPALVTYNGRAFDVNLLHERMSYYGLYVNLEPLHFDLLPYARRRFRDVLPDARLETVERHLGRGRALDLPSALVPDFYNTYTETENIGPLIPILEHNKNDLLALAALLRALAR
jgi:uncharacterized protein YprB with RNaseH-like and TPR domain